MKESSTHSESGVPGTDVWYLSYQRISHLHVIFNSQWVFCCVYAE